MAKNILITGTSSGFGKDTAETLAKAGHRVFGTMRAVNGHHGEKAKELQTRGVDIVELDVTNAASVDAAFKALFKRTGGRLDVLINNAGSLVQGISETITSEQMREMFDVNVIGIQRVLRAALPQMRKSHSGLVINIGSVLGRVTIPFMGLYGATKFAVEALTESYRYELSQLGVDVVLVQPSAYPTNLYTETHSRDDARAAEYGAVAEVEKAFRQFMADMFGGANAPNPHDVAKAIVELIATPAGKRPERLIVGAPFGADAVNAATQPIQGRIIDGLNLAGLKTLNIA